MECSGTSFERYEVAVPLIIVKIELGRLCMCKL